jgi:hypothetical protein
LSESEDKQQVLAAIQRQRARWDSVLQAVETGTDDRQQVMGGWTPKDLVAHINGWQRYTLDRLIAQRDGAVTAPPPWPEMLQGPDKTEDDRVEGINNWIYETNRERPREDVIAESRNQWDTLTTFAESLTEEQMQDEALFGRLEGESFASAVLRGSLFDHMNNEHGDDVVALIGAA